MHTLIKTLTTREGFHIEEPQWHLLDTSGTFNKVLCTGEIIGVGNSQTRFEQKQVAQGVPCSACKKQLKFLRAVKL